MSTLSELVKYTFKTVQETNFAGKVIREPVELKLTPMSQRQRDEQFGSVLLAAFNTSNAYSADRTSDNHYAMHRELMKLVSAIGDPETIEEVATWAGRLYGAADCLLLIALILRTEGLLPPETPDEDTAALPTEAAVEKMDDEKLEVLGEN